MLWLSSAPLLAQHEAGTRLDVSPPRTRSRRQMRDEIGCTCGGCEHEALSKCACGQADRCAASCARRSTWARPTRKSSPTSSRSSAGSSSFARRSTRDSIAWRGSFPYGVGAVGLVVVGMTARRWSRHPEATSRRPTEPKDPAIEERLDDELRNLD